MSTMVLPCFCFALLGHYIKVLIFHMQQYHGFFKVNIVFIQYHGYVFVRVLARCKLMFIVGLISFTFKCKYLADLFIQSYFALKVYMLSVHDKQSDFVNQIQTHKTTQMHYWQVEMKTQSQPSEKFKLLDSNNSNQFLCFRISSKYVF